MNLGQQAALMLLILALIVVVRAILERRGRA